MKRKKILAVCLALVLAFAFVMPSFAVGVALNSTSLTTIYSNKAIVGSEVVATGTSIEFSGNASRALYRAYNEADTSVPVCNYLQCYVGHVSDHQSYYSVVYTTPIYNVRLKGKLNLSGTSLHNVSFSF